MNNYTITEDSLHYKKPIYKKFKNFEDCKKWINNNLDNTKNYKVLNETQYGIDYCKTCKSIHKKDLYLDI